MAILARHWLICLGLSLLTLAALGRACTCDFVDLDDPIYVIDNPHVKSGLTLDSVQWAWTSFRGSLWQPLVWLSLQLDATLYGYSGPDPESDPSATGAWGFHTTNLLLHLANVLLVYRFLILATGASGRAALVAGLFAVHPLHVESVAWVTERKDVLCGLFFLLALCAYVDYVHRPGIFRYGLLLLWTFLALASKPMAVTLPAVLLLLDYWPLARLDWGQSVPLPAVPIHNVSWQQALLEKLPLFILSAGCSYLTLRGHAAARMPISLDQRISGAIANYGWYLQMTFWPSDLGVLHEFVARRMSPGLVLLLVLLIGITVMVFRQAQRRPEALVGWLWFIGMLLPVSGLMQAGAEEHAARFTYLPHIGLFIGIAWWSAVALARFKVPVPAQLCLACAMLIGLGILAFHQTGYWQNTRTLLELVPDLDDNVRACIILANYHGDRNENDEAIAWCAKALKKQPGDGHLLFQMAFRQARAGRRAEAERFIELSLEAQPGRPGAHGEAARIYNLLGENDKKCYHLQRHLDEKPNDPIALKELRQCNP